MAAILLLAAGLRFTGLGWGIPRYDAMLAAGTPLRSSYHPDEDIIPEQLFEMRPAAGDLRPRFFVWGTFQSYLVGGALGLAEVLGAFPAEGWRSGFRSGDQRTLERVYLTGRAVSAAFGVGGVFMVFLVARLLEGPIAGLWAAAALAVAPLHVVHGHFMTTDVAVSFWLLLAFFTALRGRLAPAGFLIGIATATKLSAAYLAPLLLLPTPRAKSARWKPLLWLLAGFVVAEPYAVLGFEAWWARVADVARGVTATAPLQAWPNVLSFLLLQLTFYALGPVGVIFIGACLPRCDRRLLAAMALCLLALLTTWITLSRYLLPILGFLTVVLGSRLARLQGSRAALAGACVLVPAAWMSVAQVLVMREPHTAQVAADWLTAHVEPGLEVAQTWQAYPILDRRRWRVSRLADPYGRSPFEVPSADVIVLDNLSTIPLRPELEALIRTRYAEVVRFTNGPTLSGRAVAEPFAAHDWKYTHPEIRVLTRNDGPGR